MLKEIKKRFTLFALIILLITSIGFSITSKNKLNSVEREITGVVSEFEPSHECKGRELSFYCFSLSSTMKTCYTLPDRKGGKRCLEDQGLWQEILYEEPLCPEKECLITQCEEPIECPVVNLTCPNCVQTCDGCGSGGGGSCAPCPTTCPPILKSYASCIAYVTNCDTGETDKWFCGECGTNAKCTKDDTLEMPWG